MGIGFGYDFFSRRSDPDPIHLEVGSGFLFQRLEPVVVVFWQVGSGSATTLTASFVPDTKPFISGILPDIRFHSSNIRLHSPDIRLAGKPDIRLENLFKIKNSFDKKNKQICRKLNKGTFFSEEKFYITISRISDNICRISIRCNPSTECLINF